MLKCVLFFIFMLHSLPLKAETRIGFEGNFSSDTSTIKTGAGNSKTYLLGEISFSLYRESPLYFTAGWISYTNTEPTATSSQGTLSITAPSAGATYLFGKAGFALFSITGLYTPTTAAAYKETGTDLETWSGSGFLGRFSIHPRLSTSFALVFSLNYLSYSFSAKSGTTVSSVSSFSHSTMVPAIGLQANW